MRIAVTLLGVLLAVINVAPASAQTLPGPFAQLQRELAISAHHAPGRVALEVQDLSTGYHSGLNASEEMPAASTIKIPVMVEVFHQMEAGKFDLNQRVTLLASDRDWGSGDIAASPIGSSFPVSTLLTQMITVSDNTAANMLIRLVGRAQINDTMNALGLEHTHLSDSIHTEGWSVRATLRTSAADMVALLSKMAREQLIDQWSSRQMIAILEEQEINTLLPAPLPRVPIAHKTGSFNDTLNDVGIVYAANEPYVIAVMTTDLRSLSSGRAFIRHVSKLTYAALQDFATWRAQNGLDQPIQPPAQAQPSKTDGDADASSDTPMWATPTPAPNPAR